MLQWHGAADWGAMGLWMVVWAVVVVLVVALIAWLVARVTGTDGRSRGGGREDDPAEILARRFAKGEIDIEEFEQRTEALRRRG